MDERPSKEARVKLKLLQGEKLIRQRTAGMEVEDFTFLETHLLKHSAGNPRALLRMVNRLRRAPAITPQLVRWVHVPSARPQISLTPVILAPFIVLVVVHLLALGLEGTEVCMLIRVGDK